MADEGKQDWLVGVVLLLLLILVGVSLVLDYGRGLDINYVNFFILLIGVGVLGALVLFFLGMGLHGDGYKPNIVDSSEVRLLADKPWSRTIAAAVLFVIFFGGGLATQSSVIPIVNPYDSSTLIAKGSELSADHSKFATALRSGVYPGFGEDVAGFIVTSILTFLFLLVCKRFDEEAFSDPFLFVLGALTSCVVWGFMFASAHALAYGSNAPAFIFAWVYGTVTQFVNQLVGAPVSILAHIGHNFIIVTSLSIAACAGALCLGVLFLPRGVLMKSVARARKGQLELYLLIGVGIAVLLAVVAFIVMYFAGGSTLSAVNPSCTDFLDVPGPVSCAATVDCERVIAEGAPLDPNVQLRCEAGVCQAKFLSCGGEVSS